MGADMNTRTVLVVEDEPYLSDLLATALSDQGYEVLKARDGLQAIRTLDEQRANQSGPCLVLLDMMLPQVDGMGVLRHITDHGHQERAMDTWLQLRMLGHTRRFLSRSSLSNCSP
jgi:DNA-binding response OmpR family regulator